MAETYSETAKKARLKVLDMIYKGQSSHIGSNFSVIDILTVLFDKMKPEDQVVLSAGWKAAAFYYFLAKRGDFPEEWLDTYCQEGSKLIGLTEPGVPGVLFAGGSMQMGLPAAIGFALAKKMKGESGRVYCLMSDGELAGGMIWESSLIVRQHNLDNLVVFVDGNKLQAMGKTSDILSSTFPTGTALCDGHDHKKIETAVQHGGVVTFVTTKGRGVSFMENNNLYHYKNLSEEEYIVAKLELFLQG